MADIFDEVGEDLRRERLKKLWSGYGVYLVGAAVLVVLATAGWRGWESWQQGRAAEAGAAFRSALASAASGDHALAADALVAFSSGAPGGYPILARMRVASERAAAGETDTALATFEEIAGNSSAPDEVRELARIRAAMIAVDAETPEQIRDRLAGLDAEGNPWRHSARELIALSEIRAGSYPAARGVLDALVADAEVPATISQRARLLQDIVTSAIGEPPAEGAS